jgi:hypothetical protein
MPHQKMLILRGNRGNYADEQGQPFNYGRGALHEWAAKEYARRRNYEAVVLDVAGNANPPKPGEKYGTRDDCPQTVQALAKFRSDDSIAALYGFSGGGFDVWWMLKLLNAKERKRIELVVVLGAPERPQSDFEASMFTGGSWEVVYKTNPLPSAEFVPKGVPPHMFGPEWLLTETPAGRYRDRPDVEED